MIGLFSLFGELLLLPHIQHNGPEVWKKGKIKKQETYR